MITDEAILRNGAIIHFCVLVFFIISMGVWESVAPRRKLIMARWQRWRSNLGILITGTLLMRLIFPAAAVGAAVIASKYEWGIFNQVSLPDWLAVLVCLLILDVAIYWQHVASHAMPWLWQLHKVHHADLDIDLTTGLRFHPLEILLSMLYKYVVIFLLGAPVLAVLIFEIVLNASAVFNHANVRLARKLDRNLRWFMVTPDMHRVHHSIKVYETDSNFGFNLSIWDRLFGSYRNQPEGGHENMIIGIEQIRNPEQNRYVTMLLFPFNSKLQIRHQQS